MRRKPREIKEISAIKRRSQVLYVVKPGCFGFGSFDLLTQWRVWASPHRPCRPSTAGRLCPEGAPRQGWAGTCPAPAEARPPGIAERCCRQEGAPLGAKDPEPCRKVGVPALAAVRRHGKRKLARRVKEGAWFRFAAVRAGQPRRHPSGASRCPTWHDVDRRPGEMGRTIGEAGFQGRWSCRVTANHIGPSRRTRLKEGETNMDEAQA